MKRVKVRILFLFSIFLNNVPWDLFSPENFNMLTDDDACGAIYGTQFGFRVL